MYYVNPSEVLMLFKAHLEECGDTLSKDSAINELEDALASAECKWVERSQGTTMLEEAKKIIKDNIKDAKYGIFDSRNIIGDPMNCIYYKDGLQVDICYAYGYFEVFGLSDEEFEALKKYYEEIRAEDKE